MLEREIPHLAAAIARYGVDHGVPTAVLSRGLAGIAGTYLDRQPAGVAAAAPGTGWPCWRRVLRHAVSQVRGGDHYDAGSDLELPGGHARSGVPASARHRWPVTLRHGPVDARADATSRPGRAWERVRRENSAWLRPWEATLPPGAAAGTGDVRGSGPLARPAGQGGPDAALAGLLRPNARRPPRIWPGS